MLTIVIFFKSWTMDITIGETVLAVIPAAWALHLVQMPRVEDERLLAGY
jgi:hypothetical protein